MMVGTEEYDIAIHCFFRDTDTVYQMTNPKRGPFIIINNETFAGRPKREGTEHDVKKLNKTFGETFGFEVVVHNDQTADEIRELIQKRM